MIEFNSDHLITGYIKELLSEFNLPNIRVYTRQNQAYHDYAVEYNKKVEKEEQIPEERNIIKTIDALSIDQTETHIRRFSYIKDNALQQYRKVDDNWKWVKLQSHQNKNEALIGSYFFNKDLPNLTSHLRIKNNIYDSYTHEYLGNYLRFLRDYSNLNLMSLYNCFSNVICNRLNLQINISNENKTTFSSEDKRYKIYMLPVKMFKNYTIAIDCAFPVEMCCGIYGTYQDTRNNFEKLPTKTYVKYNGLTFNSPIIFNKLQEENISEFLGNGEETVNETDIELAQNECDLKLFIKLPSENTSSIVVLEGEYSKFNDRTFTLENGKLKKHSNKFITNYEDFEEEKQSLFFEPISSLQLLKLNTNKSYPFADRLIEYLLGQAITDSSYDGLSEVEYMRIRSDNVRRIQKVLAENKNFCRYNGVWEEKIRHILYDYMQNFKDNDFDNHDILGYCDKDVEKYYKSVHIVTDEENANPKSKYYNRGVGSRITLSTLLNVDIYEEQTKLVEEK